MIRTDIKDGIAVLTIDQPGRAINALGPDFAHDFGTALDAVVSREDSNAEESSI